jgi:hypothetical protein
MKRSLFDKKAVTAVQGVIALILIVVVVGGIAWAASGPAATTDPKSEIQVWIDTVEQGNLTVAQPLSWGSYILGNSYTRNFTVYNRGNQTLNIALITTEPQGWNSTWGTTINNTALPPANTLQGNLKVDISTLAGSGTYTWFVKVANGTLPTPTPSTAPTETPVAQHNVTIKTQGVGIELINVTRAGGGGVPVLASEIGAAGYNITFTTGDVLTFKAYTIPDYNFASWVFSDGTFPQNTATVIIVMPDYDFTVTAKCIYMPPAEGT